MGAELDTLGSLPTAQKDSERHTPAINSPNAKPSSCGSETPSEVSAGLHRLPGASNFEKPSTKITATNKIVETMPTREEYERNDSGRKTAGMSLERNTRQREESKGISQNIHEEDK